MACGGEWSADEAFALVRKAGPMADLTAGRLRRLPRLPRGRPRRARRAPSSPSRARRPRWTSPRIWKRKGWFGVREPPGDPLVLEQRRHDHLGGVGPGAGRRRRRRHARRGVRRAAPGRATASCSTAGALEFRRLRGLDRPRHGRAAASRACRAGRATASRSRPSWPSTSPRSAPRRPDGWLGDGPLALRAWLCEASRPRPRGGRRPRRAVRGPGAAQRGPARRRRCWSRSIAARRAA